MGKSFKVQDTRDSRGKSKTTLVHFILDETGSMGSVRDATIDGFNEYINGLKKDKKNKYRMSLTKFDSTSIDVVYEDTAISKVPELTRDTYSPGSMTNLNDAIGHTMLSMEKIVGRKRKKHNVLIVIMTDGLENASIEFSAEDVSSLIKKKEKDGWTVTFLGANMDAQKVGKAYSIKEGNAKSYSVQNMGATMRGLSEATTVYASATVAGSTCDSFFEGTDDWVATTNESQSSGDNRDPALVAAFGANVVQTDVNQKEDDNDE